MTSNNEGLRRSKRVRSEICSSTDNGQPALKGSRGGTSDSTLRRLRHKAAVEKLEGLLTITATVGEYDPPRGAPEGSYLLRLQEFLSSLESVVLDVNIGNDVAGWYWSARVENPSTPDDAGFLELQEALGKKSKDVDISIISEPDELNNLMVKGPSQRPILVRAESTCGQKWADETKDGPQSISAFLDLLDLDSKISVQDFAIVNTAMNRQLAETRARLAAAEAARRRVSPFPGQSSSLPQSSPRPEASAFSSNRGGGPTNRFLAMTRVGSTLQAVNEQLARWQQIYQVLSTNRQPDEPAIVALQARLDRETEVAAVTRAALMAAHARFRAATTDTAVQGTTNAIEAQVVALGEEYRAWRENSYTLLQTHFPAIELLVPPDNTLQVIMER